MAVSSQYENIVPLAKHLIRECRGRGGRRGTQDVVCPGPDHSVPNGQALPSFWQSVPCQQGYSVLDGNLDNFVHQIWGIEFLQNEGEQFLLLCRQT